ncbi:hypothetical protein BT96DRAFT_855197 [Gymnopus androsaceus JB14]|uniref:Uncharacterized protein n=1 Tax=Gymnopus androsaceus JB14 TaxID=1447944 RepID=A0A6A4HY01_9AGAR|nr:hypothetical protein BT96DRAFT_855197 [Gymnopus androsaceus JB14]
MSSLSTAMSSSSDNLKGPGFKPNFSCAHSVTLPYPLGQVFTTLGTSEGHERVCRLSKLCTEFELLGEDTIAIPRGAGLGEVHVRTLPSDPTAANITASSSSKQPENEDAESTHIFLTRQSFTMTETVPLMFGLFKSNVILNGTLTWEANASPNLVALYETMSNSGIQVWKLRTFEEINADTTKVSERIEGVCPKWLKGIVQKEAEKGHAAHMDLYHTLFE